MKDNKYVIKHPEAFLDLMSEISGDKKYKIIKENILEEEREGITMCVIADKLVNQGIQQGIQQGGQKLFTLIDKMAEDGLTEQIPRLSKDAAFLEEMLKKYQI